MAKSKQPAAPKTVEQLVQHALKLAATKPEAKWLGKGAAALFNEKDANHADAIAVCTREAEPLLRKVGDKGALTTAGFARVSSEFSAEELVPLVKTLAHTMAAKERADFLDGVIGRNPATSPELLPLFEAAVETAKHEEEKRLAEVAKQRARDAEIDKAVARFMELRKQRRQDRVNALRREWELLGEKPSDLPAHKPAIAVPPVSLPPASAGKQTPELVAITQEDKDFRRDVARQLATAWRATWDMNKPESRDFLESAMYNISGFEMIGEIDECVEFSGKIHEGVAGVFTGDTVTIVRPGWKLEEDAGDFIVLKAVVTK